jgi:paraquat-inducible protein A
MKLSHLFIVSYFASILFFILGLLFPIFSTQWVIDIWGWYTNKVYLINSLMYFLEKGDAFLGCIIILFTLIVPFLKFIVYANYILKDFTSTNLSKILGAVNKWSMLDVFILALVLLYMKSTSFWIEMEIQKGTYFFTFSIIFQCICSTLLMFSERKNNRF